MNQKVNLLFVVTDEEKDAVNLIFSADAPITRVAEVTISGIFYGEYRLDTSQSGAYSFEARAYDGSHVSETLIVTYTVIDNTVIPTSTPSPEPTLEPTWTATPAPTETDTPYSNAARIDSDVYANTAWFHTDKRPNSQARGANANKRPNSRARRTNANKRPNSRARRANANKRPNS